MKYNHSTYINSADRDNNIYQTPEIRKSLDTTQKYKQT